MREAVILDRLMASGQVEIDDNGRMAGWMADPYDPNFVGGLARNLAEDE